MFFLGPSSLHASMSLPLCSRRRERLYKVEVSEVLIRYSKLLRAMHGTFARTTKINKSRKVGSQLAPACRALHA